MSFVAQLEPKPLWSHFDRILAIPRPSKGEEKMRRYVIQVAEGRSLEHQVDPAGNLVVRKPGTPGREEAAITILQSHLDMVQEKNSDVDFDFAADVIQPRRDGDYVTATGTTLGSDNGIGVAAMLAIMESDDVPHGPLELLFTIDEESGLTGAAQLDASMLRGRRLINLDSEEEGSLCVGCAGGADTSITLPIVWSPAPETAAAREIRLHGLKGGHSGIDIHLQRGNAIQLLARALFAAHGTAPLRLAAFAGGSAHNAIPREATAVVTGTADQLDRIVAAVETELAAIRDELATVEPSLAWTVGDDADGDDAWEEETAGRVLQLLLALPHGVLTMSYDIPGLVETSSNLATVRPTNGSLAVLSSSRSSVASALAALRRRIAATAALAGARVEQHDGYPGWKPDLDSELLRVVREVHRRELESDPEVAAIHAGLECGLIGEMVPGMDMISIGPQIEFPHSPDERVRVDSVERFWRLLTAVLAELA